MRTVKLTVVFLEQVRSAPENLFISFIITVTEDIIATFYYWERLRQTSHVLRFIYIFFFPANLSLGCTCQKGKQYYVVWDITVCVCTLPHLRQTPSGIH